jgi:hypothetical protein
MVKIRLAIQLGSEYLNTGQIEVWYLNGPIFRSPVHSYKIVPFGPVFEWLKQGGCQICCSLRMIVNKMAAVAAIHSRLDHFIQFSNVSVISCPVPSKRYYSNTGLVQYLDPRCICVSNGLEYLVRHSIESVETVRTFWSSKKDS